MFKSPKEVVVGDQVLTAEHILIATGTKPMVPSDKDVPGKHIVVVLYYMLHNVCSQDHSMVSLAMDSLS